MTTDIGWAVKQMWNGQRVRRANWYPGDFIVIMPELRLPPYNTQDTVRKVNDRTAKYIGEDMPLDSQPYFAGFAAGNKQWQPGFMFRTHDLLATDWEIAE
jgi:Protein of unknown function (DUF2829)